MLQGSPCHIYFDLEFDKRLNKKRDADEMVDILVAITFSALREKYSIEGHEEWIIELDSSTEGGSCFFFCIVQVWFNPSKLLFNKISGIILW